ncbi:MAG: polyphenol oxidase family protein, partial [Deltaproteobacteria bacterium]|nr:polyphenol oxidase family protein [Deltaproteobacteria bacterium]
MHAAIHAGWRGLAKKIVIKGIEMMQSLGARSIRISIGPAIGPCCYEVKRDVIDALAPASISIVKDSIYLDLWQEALKQAIEAGVQRDNIKITRLCTACNQDKFFSYRRDGNSAGRNISAIGGDSWLLPGLQAP